MAVNGYCCAPVHSLTDRHHVRYCYGLPDACWSERSLPYPASFEGRRRASPKGGNRGNVRRRSAAAMGYGDLNAGNEVRRVDHGDESDGDNTAA